MAGRRAVRGGNVEIRISVRECDLRQLGQLLNAHEAKEPSCVDSEPGGGAEYAPWRAERSRLHTRIIEATRDLGKLVRERDAKRERADGASHGA